MKKLHPRIVLWILEALFLVLLVSATVNVLAAEIISPSQATQLQKLLKSRPRWISEATALDFASGKITSQTDTAYLRTLDQFYPIPKSYTTTVITTTSLDANMDWKYSKTNEFLPVITEWFWFYLTLGSGVITFCLIFFVFNFRSLFTRIFCTAILGAVVVLVVAMIYSFLGFRTAHPYNHHDASPDNAILYVLFQPGLIASVLLLFVHGIKKWIEFIAVVEHEIDPGSSADESATA